MQDRKKDKTHSILAFTFRWIMAKEIVLGDFGPVIRLLQAVIAYDFHSEDAWFESAETLVILTVVLWVFPKAGVWKVPNVRP